MKIRSLPTVAILLGCTAAAGASTTSKTNNNNDLPIQAWMPDFISHLPDYGTTPTPHFSGYLDGSSGCDTDTNGPICKIHYWLALAETNPADAPLVLWLNGGPGSSSLLGFLTEEGPLLMNAKGGLMENPYSWTKYVNLVAIEAPVGVGYSYCSRQVEGKPCHNTDRYTASTSRAALVDFFDKYPDLKANDFFITGESYAGVYIPTLTKELLDHTDINLKGIAVGDPCTDNEAQEESMDSLWYAHKNALVDDDVYDLLWNKCSVRLPNLMTRGGVSHVISELNVQLQSIDHGEERRAKALEFYHEIILNGNVDKLKDSHECTLAFRKFLISSSNGLSQSWKDLYIDDYSLFAPVSSLEDEQMATYMSRPDVRQALHVQEAPTKTWPDADVGFHYLKEYNACNWQDEIILQGVSMVDIYQEIIPQLDHTWIYNGDTDPCVSYEGTRLAVKQILLDEVDGGSYRPWFYNQTAASLDLLEKKAALFGPGLVAQNMGPQFGGQVVDYEEGLKFVTFHGSGHMVPQFQPQSALHFLKKFIHGYDLAPLMPLNETLTDMGDDDFYDAANGWTETARGCPFVDKTEDTKVEEEKRQRKDAHVVTTTSIE